MKRPSDLVCLWWLGLTITHARAFGSADTLAMLDRIGATEHAARGLDLLDRALVRNLREANRVRGTVRETLLREQCRMAERMLPVVGREAGEIARRALGGR